MDIDREEIVEAIAEGIADQIPVIGIFTAIRRFGKKREMKEQHGQQLQELTRESNRLKEVLIETRQKFKFLERLSFVAVTIAIVEGIAIIVLIIKCL